MEKIDQEEVEASTLFNELDMTILNHFGDEDRSISADVAIVAAVYVVAKYVAQGAEKIPQTPNKVQYCNAKVKRLIPVLMELITANLDHQLRAEEPKPTLIGIEPQKPN